MRKFHLLFFIFLIAIALPVVAQDAPSRIVVEDPGLYPEGIEWDAEGERFLITSLTRGTVTEVFDDGTFSTFIEDEDLISNIGIHIDAERGRVLVASSDPGAGSRTSEATLNVFGKLGIYDLETGERLHLVDAGALRPDGGHFANDIAVDADGNAYLTDSFTPVIYKIDLDGEAEVFLEDDTFAAEGFNLNGIDYHPDGYLLTVTLNTGRLFKVPIDDPAAFTEVELEGALVGGDGVIFTADNDLIVNVGSLGGEANRLVLLNSADDWASATIISSVEPEYLITTATLRGGEPYVIYGHLDVLFGGGETRETFEIDHLPFDAMGAGGDAATTAMVDGDAANGEQLFSIQGCVACHFTDSEDPLVGPGLLNIGERAATRVEGLSAVEYIHQSITDPGAFVVEGFTPVMPPTFGQTLSEQEINDLIAYLLTLQ